MPSRGAADRLLRAAEATAELGSGWSASELPARGEPVLQDRDPQRHLVASFRDPKGEREVVSEAVRICGVVAGQQLPLSIDVIAAGDPHATAVLQQQTSAVALAVPMSRTPPEA